MLILRPNKPCYLYEVILANVGTVVCFRTGSTQDEKLLLPLFSPYIDKGELSNLESYNFYVRIMAIKPQEPMSGETIIDNSSRKSEHALSKSIIKA